MEEPTKLESKIYLALPVFSPRTHSCGKSPVSQATQAGACLCPGFCDAGLSGLLSSLSPHPGLGSLRADISSFEPGAEWVLRKEGVT